MTVSKWRWFYDFQTLWEIVETRYYKCCVKYQKHLKTSVEFAKNANGGLHFSAKLRAKGEQVYGQETFSHVLFKALFKSDIRNLFTPSL